MVFFTYIFFYILKTTRKYGKNLPEMCGKKVFPGANMTADFRGRKCQTAKILSQAKFCAIFSGYMLLTGK